MLNRKNFFHIFLCSLMILSFLCGCKKNDKDTLSTSASLSSLGDDFQTGSSSQTPSQTSSKETGGDASQNSSDTAVDPEPAADKNGTGTVINATQLETKTGKANGIDVSKWQGKINWAKVKAAGIDFAIIRVGYRAENGKIYKDEYADYNLQQANNQGLLTGVYFFSTAINQAEALEEAKWVAEQIKGYSISYPVVYNCEGFLSTSSRMYGLTNSIRTQNATTFLSHIESLGYEGMLYAAKSELTADTYWQTSSIEQNYKIWVAHYSQTTYPQVETPDYSGKFDMWQYTNMGKVDGVNGYTDLVVSYFTKEKASPKSNAAVPEATAPVEKDNTYTAVNEQVTAKDEVNLRDAATTNSNVVGSLKNGDVVPRTAVGTNGWSKLSYNGQTVYAVSSYLTTDLNYATPSEPETAPTDSAYTTVNEQITAKSETNLRSVPTSKDDSTIVHTLKNGEVATRTGIGSNGWSKLSYNGQTVYALTSYLTTDLSYNPDTAENDHSTVVYSPVNEQVTAKSEANLRSVPTSKDDSTIVYTLKNGEYVTRVGIGSNGWSKLSYNGQTVYAVTSYLQTEGN